MRTTPSCAAGARGYQVPSQTGTRPSSRGCWHQKCVIAWAGAAPWTFPGLRSLSATRCRSSRLSCSTWSSRLLLAPARRSPTCCLWSRASWGRSLPGRTRRGRPRRPLPLRSSSRPPASSRSRRPSGSARSSVPSAPASLRSCSPAARHPWCRRSRSSASSSTSSAPRQAVWWTCSTMASSRWRLSARSSWTRWTSCWASRSWSRPWARS
mmetsp:Transcript_13349/g.37964  ORF Transcript_13349/g.37964 Transcript_13349/m.37964 type:complete len:210 (-) Transcript_13349:658-1287(-)